MDRHDILAGFAEACFDQNSTDELIDALLQRKADAHDLKDWNLTSEQWREAIAEALRERINAISSIRL